MLLGAALAGCGGGGGGNSASSTSSASGSTSNSSSGPAAANSASGAANNTAPTVTPSTGLSLMAAVGEQIFQDIQLSPSHALSCATCHSQANGFAQGPQLLVPLGGPFISLPGFRNTPSIMYARYTPPFSLTGIAQGPGQPTIASGLPAGGLFLDGRVDTLQQQAGKPLLSPFEMANTSSAQVLQELQTRPYLAQFQAVFGAATLASADATLTAVTQAVAAYETESSLFHPFQSKYDAFLNGQAQLSASEADGLAVFNDPSKGNCASCHTSASFGGVPALFTDHSYRAIGSPRNWNIVFNQDAVLGAGPNPYPYVPLNGSTLGAPNHVYYDLGVCGPLRTDLTADTNYCGLFKVPTLRNVALKPRYFHNGVFNTLCDAINFHLTRDALPAHWYRQPDGVTPDQPYNDLPLAYAGNVTRQAPFSNGTPALSNSELNDVIAFLTALTDGYNPINPAASPATRPAPCANVTQ
ncbi:MAG: diacylglycerol kinase [Burkholderiaceae bacterium]|nr:diacylglycerol kinase [Burkholderiaceae bacterium]